MNKLIFIAAFIFLASSSFGQSLKKGNKLIANKNFQGAEAHFNKTLSSNSTDPSANFGMGLIYSDSTFNERDLLKALNYVNIAKVNFAKLDAGIKEKISEDLTESIIDAKFMSIDDELLSYMKTEKDTAFVIKFLETCSFSAHFLLVNQRYNDVMLDVAQSKNTIDAYEFYIANFSDSINVAKAVNYRNQLVFESVKDSNKVQCYEEFISDYPDAAEVEAAIQHINTLIFESVKDTNTIVAYNDYIEKYPESKKIAEAEKLRNQLAFDKALKINTVLVYEAFIKDYPEAEQVSMAEVYIKELNNWTCIPGMKVGSIVYNSSFDDLVDIFGAENLKNDSLKIDGELYRGITVYPNESDKRLFIIWKNKEEMKYPDRIVILGTKWQTHKGVKLGSTLEEITMFNENDFDLSGFRKKGEGTVISWKGGELGVLHILGKNFFLQLSYDESKFFNISEKGLLVLTNSDFVSTDNEDLKGIDLKAARMEILFPE